MLSGGFSGRQEGFLFIFQIRKTKKVSVFPVGLASGSLLSSPVVENKKVVDFYDTFRNREFAMDLAGFAINVDFYKKVQFHRKKALGILTNLMFSFFSNH